MVIFEAIPSQERIIQEKRKARLTKRLSELTTRSGYEIIQINGQRIYAPPASANIKPPPKGCEIFIGRLTKSIYEDELIPLFEKVGRIYKFRMMLDFNEKSRGYAFATYFNSDDANKAVGKFNNYEIRPNFRIGVYKSVDNCKLFIGNLPVDKTREEVWEMVQAYTNGVVDMLMFQDCQNTHLNRGFVFVEFENHRCAAMARRQLTPNNLNVWDRMLYVDWADPLPEVNNETMSRVTILFLNNLPPDFSSSEIRACICRKISSQMVLKIYKNRSYAFVHFSNRSSAEYAFSKLSNFSIMHYKIRVEWARPRCYSKTYRLMNPPLHFCTSVPPNMRRIIRNKRSITGSNFSTSANSTVVNYNNNTWSSSSMPTSSNDRISENSVVYSNFGSTNNYFNPFIHGIQF